MKVSVLVLFGLLACAVLARPHSVYAVDEDDDDNGHTQAFEEDNNNNDDDNDNDDDVAHEVSTSSKVFARLESLEEAIGSSSLSASQRQAALENLNHIRQDAMHMETASSYVKDDLKEAMHLRMEALKLQLASDDADDDDDVVPSSHNVLEEDDGDDDDDEDNVNAQDANNDDDDDVVAKITQDVSRVEDSLDVATLGAKIARKAKKNLEAIRADADRYEHSDHATRERLSEAMKLRMAALKLMLESQPSSAETHDAVVVSEAERVQQDITSIENEIHSAHLSKHAKREVLDNLHAIRRDAEEMASHPSVSRSRQLKRAMKLRVHALHEQLN